MCRYMKVWIFVTLFAISGIAEGSRWSRTGNLNVARCGYPSALLPNGKVMIITTQYSSSAGYEIFDPATGTWTRKPMPAGSEDNPCHNTAILLPNGKVLYTTGHTTQNWLYDPSADAFNTSLVSHQFWKCGCWATLLKDGQVLLADNGQNCFLYDYLSDAITPTTESTKSSNHWNAVEILLPSGKVLLIGGGDDAWMGGSKECEIYDPGSQTWSYTTGPMSMKRASHVAVLLPPPWSKVLVAGRREKNLGTTRVCELYDPTLDTWSDTDSLYYLPRGEPGMALLPSGKALIIGGMDIFGFEISRKCELYDPETETWTDTDTTEVKRSHLSTAILQTGKVLLTAGVDKTFSPWVNNTAEIYDPSDGEWAGKPDLNVGRGAHTTTPLPIIPTSNCSTNVLIAGGENSSGALASCELYNYSLDNVSVTDDLNEKRTHHTATLLPSGEVLVAGGKDGATIRSSSELYDVTAEKWTTIGAMTNARFDHSATLLKDGKVLVTGGEDAGYLSSCEMYNSGTWTPTANVMATPRARHTAVILLNGNLLVIGGQTTGGSATALCEIWNGTSWAPAESLSTARYWHTATLLQSGKVLVIGGTTNGGTPLSSCEIFDPDSNKWFPEDSLNTARYRHNTILLYSGLVLVTGGNNGSNSCEIWDPAAEWDSTTNTHQWKVTAPLSTGRAYHSSVLVPDTMPFILTIGGKGEGGGYLRAIEEYDVGLGYRKIWQSEITNYSAVTLISPSMDITGTLFRGVSEADGGNYCHIANNDHPIISLVRVGGGNWQGNGGGEILHMPLSSSWDDTHTIVHPEITDFHGYYRLWSIVNGIPCKWETECHPSTGVEDIGTTHKLFLQVLPSPSPGIAYIKFAAHTSGTAAISIYDCSGSLVRKITENYTDAGAKEIRLDKLMSGVYFYHIKYGDLEDKGKFVILF